MTVRYADTPAPQRGAAGGNPEALPLETLAALQQVLGEVIDGLRERATAQVAREAGAIEYASWLRLLR